MDVTISVKGLTETIRELISVDRDQIPFATAKALTLTAKSRQKLVQATLGQRFILRREAWARQGVRIEPATKTKLQAVIKDINPYMALQEEGGQKLPMHGSKVAVPLTGARPTPRALIREENLPAAVMANGGFIRGNIMYRVVLKAGRRKAVSRAIGGIREAANWARKIIAMYALVPHASVKKRYGFEQTVTQGVVDEFRRNFEVTFEEARKTAK
jgi:hypothetical protein